MSKEKLVNVTDLERVEKWISSAREWNKKVIECHEPPYPVAVHKLFTVARNNHSRQPSWFITAGWSAAQAAFPSLITLPQPQFETAGGAASALLFIEGAIRFLELWLKQNPEKPRR